MRKASPRACERARRTARARRRRPRRAARDGHGVQVARQGLSNEVRRRSRAAPRSLRARSTAQGLVRARLRSRGDWDVAVFDAKTKRVVAASAAFRGNEVAEGFVKKGQRLLVQACRFAGPRLQRAR